MSSFVGHLNDNIFSSIINSNSNSTCTGLQRSVSNQERGSNDNLLIFEELDLQYLANVKKRSINNVTTSHDPGYTYKKGMKVNGKVMKYTEDRNINFSFDRFHVIGATDGHGGSPKMSILASGSFPIFFIENYKKLETIELALLKTFEDINNLAETKGGIGGTTLTVCVIDKVNKKAYVANLGDSVTQIFRRIENSFVSVFRTVCHDADNLVEQQRLTDLFGSSVKFDFGRGLLGGSKYAKLYGHEIMVVGGIGDFQFPSGFIKRIPDINVFDLQDNDVIISSSDGFYETFITGINILSAGRDEQEIICDLNKLYDENKLYNSTTLAYDLMESHAQQIARLYGNVKEVEGIKKVRDNNVILTYIIN